MSDAELRAWAEDRRTHDQLCVQCGRTVEEARRIYVHPTCYSCLPPPVIVSILNCPVCCPKHADAAI